MNKFWILFLTKTTVFGLHLRDRCTSHQIFKDIFYKFAENNICVSIFLKKMIFFSYVNSNGPIEVVSFDRFSANQAPSGSNNVSITSLQASKPSFDQIGCLFLLKSVQFNLNKSKEKNIQAK